jgi:hypothetical protein
MRSAIWLLKQELTEQVFAYPKVLIIFVNMWLKIYYTSNLIFQY